ncbi:MAG: alkaline phosphatase D [Candidatus Azotimanducaceae bacterium]|jgi:alkaline phosphatase D
MSDKITRRQALKGATGASISLLLPAACDSTGVMTQSDSKVFSHGVASGDPDQSSVVIWTRVSVTTEDAPCNWFVASDAGFKNIVAKGQVIANNKRDFTVKVLVENLSAGQEYFYRFDANGASSMVGQTKTLESGHLEDLTLAVATCSNYSFGYFNAYESIANDGDIDLVIHLGDYIYEHGVDGYGGDVGKKIGRNHSPAHEILTLSDYRQRHAQQKSDQGSLAMHARHPIIVIWDDHETANNPWTGGAQNHQAEEGKWSERREASLQAYYEWLPIRDPKVVSDRVNFWRHYKFGDLASIITLESRHTGRSKQIEYSEHLPQIRNAAEAETFLNEVVGAENRNMLSDDMKQFLQTELSESVSSNRRWRILGNQSIMAKSTSPSLDEPIFDSLRETLTGYIASTLKGRTRLGELNLPDDLDAWDGYPRAREELYQISKNAGAEDLLVLSGDSHSFWANALYDSDNQSMGLELGSTGISSPRSLLSLGEQGIERFDKINMEHNKEIVWSDGRHRGYIRLTINHEGAHADFIAVSNVESRDFSAKTIHSVDIAQHKGKLQYE